MLCGLSGVCCVLSVECSSCVVRGLLFVVCCCLWCVCVFGLCVVCCWLFVPCRLLTETSFFPFVSHVCFVRCAMLEVRCALFVA